MADEPVPRSPRCRCSPIPSEPSGTTNTFQLGDEVELMPGVVCRVVGNYMRGFRAEIHIRRDDLEWRQTRHGPQIVPKGTADVWPWSSPRS